MLIELFKAFGGFAFPRVQARPHDTGERGSGGEWNVSRTAPAWNLRFCHRARLQVFSAALLSGHYRLTASQEAHHTVLLPAQLSSRRKAISPRPERRHFEWSADADEPPRHRQAEWSIYCLSFPPFSGVSTG